MAIRQRRILVQPSVHLWKPLAEAAGRNGELDGHGRAPFGRCDISYGLRGSLSSAFIRRTTCHRHRNEVRHLLHHPAAWHWPLHARDDLDDVFAWKEERTLSQALTLQYDKVIFILKPTDQAKAAIGKRVTVIDYPDGRLSIRYNGVELAYRTFDKIRQVDQGAIADNKRLGAVLAMIRDEQLRRAPSRRSGPRRRDQRDARLFKVG
jgi:hypothetical protein